MYIYLILFFLLYLIGRYLFLSLPLREGNIDEDIDEEITKGVSSVLNEVVDNVEDDVVDDVDNNSDYSVPSMETIRDQLQDLQRQSISQADEIEILNNDVKNLTPSQI